MMQTANDSRAQLSKLDEELEFYKNILNSISNKYLRELEEYSQYSSLLNDKIKIIDDQQKHLSMILDSIPADVYISDMDSNEVIFMNAFMKKSFGRDCVGEICWRAFQNREKPCPHCTNEELRKNIGKLDKVITWEAKNPVNNKWYLNNDIAIPWKNGKSVRMQIAIDISNRIEMEQALKESQSQYHSLSRMLRLMCDNVPDMIWAKDLKKRFVFANKALCENLLNAKNTEEPIGKTDLFFAKRERCSYPEKKDWHTFGEVCRDSDAITMESGCAQQFNEFGNVQGKFLFLDVHKAPFLNEKGEMIGTVGSARDVTRAKENEAKLRAKESKYRKKIENRYRTIIQTTQEGVCSLDGSCNILFANEKMADILGFEVDELQGRNLSEFVPPTLQEEHVHRLRNRTADLNESYEQIFQHKNGQECWVRVSTTSIENDHGNLNGSFLMFSDITAVKHASQQLFENFERLKMAQTVGKIGSWEYDLKEKKIWISEEGCKICGISPAQKVDFLEENLHLFLQQITSELEDPTSQTKENDGYEIEFTIGQNTKKNKRKYIKSVAEWIKNDQGKPIRVVGVIQDISGLKEAEIALKEAHAQLLHAEKLSAVGKLSASIAHEFNNPLQGILNIISGVKERSTLSLQDTELMEMAVVECNRMKELIKNLQDFNKPTHSELDLVDIQGMIKSLLLLSKKELITRGVIVTTHFPPHIPKIKIVGDQIKQVILNILQNAIDACQKGGTITIKLELSQNRIITSVSDTGCGINPDDLKYIFDPFFTTKPDLKGTGLGLSVSYGIIKNHGGRIDVESKPGVGSTFSIALPLKGRFDDK